MNLNIYYYFFLDSKGLNGSMIKIEDENKSSKTSKSYEKRNYSAQDRCEKINFVLFLIYFF